MSQFLCYQLRLNLTLLHSVHGDEAESKIKRDLYLKLKFAWDSAKSSVVQEVTPMPCRTRDPPYMQLLVLLEYLISTLLALQTDHLGGKCFLT